MRKDKGDTIWDLGKYLAQVEACLFAAIAVAFGLTIMIATAIVLFVRGVA